GGLRLDLADGGEAEPDPQRMVDARERQQLIRAAILTLAPQDQAAIRWFYDEQQSLREIAAALGTSVAAVKVRLYSARRRIRDRLLTECPEFAAALPARRKQMVKMTVADVVERDTPHGDRGCTILLRSEEGERGLPIWVGHAEAMA